MPDIDVIISDSVIEENAADVLKRNIIFFCCTPKGSLPQMRDYGIDFAVLDEPFQSLRMKITVDIITGVKKYFGIRISDINVTADENGKINIKITI